MQLELGMDNKSAASSLGAAVNILKKYNVQDELQDIMGDFQEIQQDQQQTDNLFEQMAGMNDNEDEIADDMQALERELAQEQEQQIQNQLNGIPQVNKAQQQQQQQQQQQMQYNQQQNQPQKQKNNVDDLLAAQLDF
ncbi:hypothetical protein IMG5_102010 [Ichthyophthirius multifiliis]|uniref:Uncharacterized protein n=1 Tax=Ichthyophthirius multifiliis TaxID=5932 RepID=G0QSL2_ICHMU|nr:hypothetical protein IMG5_102010 [Ichthyophthirius multifiliis]EGR31792.1 hypothetical protein IMG5_102010 [Ichthyophthirius multifiliis]|eukprot:XP_004035278.1 hypothetical protein IMG5_102010 [Ichthyophthirius multifiliis]